MIFLLHACVVIHVAVLFTLVQANSHQEIINHTPAAVEEADKWVIRGQDLHSTMLLDVLTSVAYGTNVDKSV